MSKCPNVQGSVRENRSSTNLFEASASPHTVRFYGTRWRAKVLGDSKRVGAQCTEDDNQNEW